MSLFSPNSFVHRPKSPECSKTYVSASCDPGLKMATEAKPMHLSYDDTKERIKKMFAKVELSVSSYDTAWVAMVPSPNSPEVPCFPQCVNWVLNNQLKDGSWGLHQHYPLLIKDALTSTLACVLALKRWGVGEAHINKGLQFIKSNFDSSADEKQHAPIGFDIIFPGMIEYANDLNLNLHLGSSVLDRLLHKRDLELKILEGRNAYLADVSEGLGKSQDWKMVMKYQKENGSLFNSPSTTAAALIHRQNSDCLSYLRSILNLFGNAGTCFMDVSNNMKSFDQNLRKKVDDTLMFPHYANLERLESRRFMKYYSTDNTRIMKTSYCIPNISNEDFLKLAVEDFNICQSIHREELKELASWVVDYKLDQLKFARQKLAYCYFSAAATLFSPQLKDARICWAKNGVLTTVVDDFFDVGGSEEELINLIHLVEKWDVNMQTDCCSDQVRIIFSALHSTICEIRDKAVTTQGRNVTGHVIEIWLDLLNSMLREAQWTEKKTVPTIDEYMKNGYVSFALGPIVLPALYFVGPKLSEEIVQSPEFHILFKLMSTSGRLLNDFRGFKRETEEGKLNAVSLSMIHGGGLTEEEAVEGIKINIEIRRRELLRLVLQEKYSVVPRACKNVFWEMSKVLHLFYMNDDGFTSNSLSNAVNEVLQEPVVLEQV